MRAEDSKIDILGLDIEHPELGFHETRSHKLLTTALKELGFTVTDHPGMPTAFIATFEHGHGGRVVGINAEYDALRGIGQGVYAVGFVPTKRAKLVRVTELTSKPTNLVNIVACGHNLIAICGVGSAAALKAAMQEYDIPGKIKLIGTPGKCLPIRMIFRASVTVILNRIFVLKSIIAEEGGGGKVILIKDGVYDDLDCCMMAHPGASGMESDKDAPDGTCTLDGPGSLARSSFSAEFFGRSAHAGVSSLFYRTVGEIGAGADSCIVIDWIG